MKTIRYQTDGIDRFFTPSRSAWMRNETEEEFLHRSARKVVPEGVAFDIVENALLRMNPDMPKPVEENSPAQSCVGMPCGEPEKRVENETLFTPEITTPMSLPKQKKARKKHLKKKMKKENTSIYISIKNVYL
mgnify:CR=1 FL=1